MKRLMAMLAGVCAAMLCAVVTAVLPVQHAAAAGLTQVTGFGDNPGDLQMYVYVPDTVRASPAIVMALHPCGGSGPGFYSSSEFASLADRYGFLVIFPSASNKKFNCFDNWSDASKVRGGRVNVQFLTDPHGELIWASPALPGSTHYLTAAREHGIIDALTARAIACYADKGYVGAGGAVGTPYKRKKHRKLGKRKKLFNRHHATVRALGE